MGWLSKVFGAGESPAARSATPEVDVSEYLFIRYREHYRDFLQGHADQNAALAELFLFRAWVVQFGFRMFSSDPPASERLIQTVVNTARLGARIVAEAEGVDLESELGGEFMDLLDRRWQSYDAAVIGSGPSSGIPTREIIGALSGHIGAVLPAKYMWIVQDFVGLLNAVKEEALSVGLLKLNARPQKEPTTTALAPFDVAVARICEACYEPAKPLDLLSWKVTASAFALALDIGLDDARERERLLAPNADENSKTTSLSQNMRAFNEALAVPNHLIVLQDVARRANRPVGLAVIQVVLDRFTEVHGPISEQNRMPVFAALANHAFRCGLMLARDHPQAAREIRAWTAQTQQPEERERPNGSVGQVRNAAPQSSNPPTRKAPPVPRIEPKAAAQEAPSDGSQDYLIEISKPAGP